VACVRSPLVALALAGFGLTACGSSDKSPAAKEPAKPPPASGRQARPPTASPEIETLLGRRARALGSGDARAYAATAVGPQRRRDVRAARRTRGLGVVNAGYEVSVPQRTGSRAVLRGRSTYELTGIPGRFGGRRRIVVVKTARGWRVASETSRRERHPWELGRVARSTSPHFVVIAPASLGLGDLPQSLERGYRYLRAALPSSRLRRRYAVVVAASAARAVRLTRDIQGVETLAAITDSQVREAGRARRTTRVVSQRLLVVWPVWSRLGADERVRIVAHELTHAVLASSTSGRTPAWLIEGVALFASGDQRVAEAAAELNGLRPPRLAQLDAADSIARSSGARQGRVYALASAAAHYVAERYGQDDLLRLYESFNEPALPGAPGDAGLVDRALRRTLGISLRRLERELRAWVLARSGGS
jgi:hypothetical protein